MRVRREAYRGTEARVEDQRPDVIVIRVTVAQPGTEVGLDVLWVGFKAPSHRKAHGWNEVMREAVDRLEVAHANRNVFLILAIGIEWMMFEWVPIPTNPGGGRGFQSSHLTKQTLGMSMAEYVMLLLPVQASLQTRIGPHTHLIYTSVAHSLDYWITDSTGQRLLNQSSIQRLETCFAHIQGAQYNGPPNPRHFAL